MVFYSCTYTRSCTCRKPHIGIQSGTNIHFAAEQPARRKFLRSANENDNPLRRQNNAPPPAAEQKGAFGGRRRSTLRENKAPLLGPRPLELQQTKR